MYVIHKQSFFSYWAALFAFCSQLLITLLFVSWGILDHLAACSFLARSLRTLVTLFMISLTDWTLSWLQLALGGNWRMSPCPGLHHHSASVLCLYQWCPCKTLANIVSIQIIKYVIRPDNCSPRYWLAQKPEFIQWIPRSKGIFLLHIMKFTHV